MSKNASVSATLERVAKEGQELMIVSAGKDSKIVLNSEWNSFKECFEKEQEPWPEFKRQVMDDPDYVGLSIPKGSKVALNHISSFLTNCFHLDGVDKAKVEIDDDGETILCFPEHGDRKLNISVFADQTTTICVARLNDLQGNYT